MKVLVVIFFLKDRCQKAKCWTNYDILKLYAEFESG